MSFKTASPHIALICKRVHLSLCYLLHTTNHKQIEGLTKNFGCVSKILDSLMAILGVIDVFPAKISNQFDEIIG
jgi:hypothetical protein